MKRASKSDNFLKQKISFPLIRTQRLTDAMVITSFQSASSPKIILPLISPKPIKLFSQARNINKQRFSKQSKQEIQFEDSITIKSSARSTSNIPSIKSSLQIPKNNDEEIQLEKSSYFKSLSKKQMTIREEPDFNPADKNGDKELSDESYEIENDVFNTLPSISSIDIRKFNSPSARKDSTKKSTVGSLISEQSLKYMQSSKFSTLKRETTINSILEEMNNTPSVSVFHELKFKLVTKDSLLEGINGTLMRWKVVEQIGSGTFGQVFKAINIESGKIFAIKRLFYNPASQQQVSFIDNILQEIKVLQKLWHGHIVKYLGSEKINDNYCMYIEYLPGGTISKLLYKVGALPEITVRAYTRQILKGLKYLHSNGVIHRDLKSDNILLDSNGKLKICDFGCSKRYENEVNESGFNNSVKGSLPWMAPEVMKQSGYGRKADIWSLGCVVIEMLSGKPPWNGIENQVMLMMNVIVYGALPEMPARISDCAKDFILKCLNRDPLKRPTAEEILAHPFVCKGI